jgi:regulator of protease activity HflC (stomatin/prohibitin superfamily)
MKNGSNRKFKIGALDIFIIVCLVFAIAAVGTRFFVNRNSGVGDKVQMENYVVSIKINDIKDSSAQSYFEPGTNFYLEDTNAIFGAVREGLTINDAEKVYEMPNGDVVIAQNNATGDLYRVDVEMSVDVLGKIDAEGRFLLNGNTYICVNKEIKIYSKYLSVTGTITSVTKVSK